MVAHRIGALIGYSEALYCPNPECPLSRRRKVSDRGRHLGVAGGTVIDAIHERLRPFACLTPDLRRAEMVERKPRDVHRHAGRRRLDLLAATAQPEQGGASSPAPRSPSRSRSRASARQWQTPGAHSSYSSSVIVHPSHNTHPLASPVVQPPSGFALGLCVRGTLARPSVLMSVAVSPAN